MDLATYRRSKGLTQAQFARVAGLRSKGYLSRIETGSDKCPLKLALRLEDLSDGKIRAIELVSDEDADLLRRFIVRATMTGRA